MTRPILKWHGGKWKLAPWILTYFPIHRVYVEPYGGAASVLMQKPRSYGEIYNDLDSEVVNLFRVLREPEKASELQRLLALTPFAREEHVAAYELADDSMERARRLVILSFMGFGSNGHNRQRKTGFRSNSNRSGTTPAGDWGNYSDAIPAFVERLRGVCVENRPAIQVMLQHDSPDTLHYADPPYLPETRSLKNPYDLTYAGGMYAHEMTQDEHKEMLSALRSLAGMVVLSGYPSRAYDIALPTWHRVECVAHADGALDRTEVLWLNPLAVSRLKNVQKELICF